MTLDLMTTEFSSCELFGVLPKKDALFYTGSFLPHVQRYRVITEGIESHVLAASIIRRDESLMWEGAKDLLGRAVKNAAVRVRGVYTFELLAFNVQKELTSFNPQELAQMLINCTLRLRPGEDMLVRYSSVYGILRKMVDETWGKIAFTTSVEVVPETPGSIYSLMGQMLKKSETIKTPVTILINDLSAVPLYDPTDEAQQIALEKLKKKIAKASLPFSRDCWVEGACVSFL